MENAGRGATEIVLARLARRPGRVAIVCGGGNNGGDGLVVARRLLAAGKDVIVLLASRREKLVGDALANHDAFAAVGGRIVECLDMTLDELDDEFARATIVVDALLGTGLDRDVTGFFASVIGRMNRAEGFRVALDVPSGLDANTGRPRGVAVSADQTVTFAASKLGLATSAGAERAGRVSVVDIGIPEPAVSGSSARMLERVDVAAWLSRRPVSTHKGAAGKVAIVAGSPGRTGAALLVARGALRAGAGLVTLCALPEVAEALDRRVLEEMTARLDRTRLRASLDENLAGANAVVIGPGVGLDAEARQIVEHVVLSHPGLIVVDADALTHFSGRLPELRTARGKLLLTPHPGEMARLLYTTTTEVESDRFSALTRAVDESGASVILKGMRTLIGAPGELPVVNPSGSPALATAGSGDVLSGIAGAFMVALHDPFRAACVAAYVHGVAGEDWSLAHDGADRGLLAHEIADAVPRVIAAVTRTRDAMPD